MSLHLIYKHTCLISGKSYIGQTKRLINIRLNEHIQLSNRWSQTHFHRVIRKYGVENFTSEIIVENVPDYMISAFEKYWINFYNTFKNGYNMTEGGEGTVSRIMTNETKIKIKKSYLIVNSETGLSIAQEIGLNLSKSLIQNGKFFNVLNKNDEIIYKEIPLIEVRKISQSLPKSSKECRLGKNNQSISALRRQNKLNLIGYYVEEIIWVI